MKLADDFLIKCSNYETEYKRIKDSMKGEYSNKYGRNECITNALCNELFIIEEKDFNIAIELCKELKKSIQKKAYEHKLNQFKETGTYAGAGNPASFIDELRKDLIRNRRYNSDKRILVNEALKNGFPEMQEIDAAYQILCFVSLTSKYEKELEKAQSRLLLQKEKLTKLKNETEGGKSILEIVEQWKEHDGD
ncbi:MAG: hypothetical protein VW580_00930 [Flavobacteriaceae bacterium]